MTNIANLVIGQGEARVIASSSVPNEGAIIVASLLRIYVNPAVDGKLKSHDFDKIQEIIRQELAANTFIEFYMTSFFDDNSKVVIPLYVTTYRLNLNQNQLQPEGDARQYIIKEPKEGPTVKGRHYPPKETINQYSPLNTIRTHDTVYPLP